MSKIEIIVKLVVEGHICLLIKPAKIFIFQIFKYPICNQLQMYLELQECFTIAFFPLILTL